MGVPGPDPQRPHREVLAEEAASEGLHVGEGHEFPLYTFRHTCLTRWAAHMDPYTLGYLAGHSDFSTTRRYVHPQARRQGRHGARAQRPVGRATAQSGSTWSGVGTKLGTKAKRRLETKISNRRIYLKCKRMFGRGEWIRTTDLLVPNQAL